MRQTTVGGVFTGLCIDSGALDPAVGAGGYGGVVVRSPAGARVCVQATTPHQAPGRPHTHAQGEGQEEGGPVHLDLRQNPQHVSLCRLIMLCQNYLHLQ